MDKILTKPRNPAHRGILPFNISIPPSKEASLEEARAAGDEIKVFSDGSSREGKVGAAAILIREGQPHRTLRLHLGPDSEHTVHEAELVGILLVIQLIRTERHVGTSSAIGGDNQAALEAFNSDLKSPAHNIAREILRSGVSFQKRRGRKKHPLTLRWTAGHVGIEGNELAKKEAKRAAKGKTSDLISLPRYLRRPLTINSSAVKQKNNVDTKRRWTKEWRNSKRGKIIAQSVKKTPSAHYLHSISSHNISRKSASLVTQILTEHLPLNVYLKRFNKVNSTSCPACGAARETVRHFLLTCPSYAHERWVLNARLKTKHKTMTLANMIENPDTLAALTNFIHSSHRFSYAIP